MELKEKLELTNVHGPDHEHVLTLELHISLLGEKNNILIIIEKQVVLWIFCKFCIFAFFSQLNMNILCSPWFKCGIILNFSVTLLMFKVP